MDYTIEHIYLLLFLIIILNYSDQAVSYQTVLEITRQQLMLIEDVIKSFGIIQLKMYPLCTSISQRCTTNTIHMYT